MSETDSVDNLLESFDYTGKAEKSMKEFSNWILGISLGLCAVLVFKYGEIAAASGYKVYIYKTLVFLSMVNVLLSGINKFLILKRDTKMSIQNAELKKVRILGEINKKTIEDIKIEQLPIIKKWVSEMDKLVLIGKILNWSILLTLITILSVGSFIFFTL